jgi:NADH-quinone oxidoreductase subunit C
MNVDEMDYFPMRKEYPLEDQTRIDKDDEMFGRGGSLGFGNEPTANHHHTIAEEEKKASQEILNGNEEDAQLN